jgi:hypothetical protein
MSAVVKYLSVVDVKLNKLNKEKLINAIENYDAVVQDILQNYLQPFTKNKTIPNKPNLRDGIIERETHGAMHAVRVLVYVRIIHEHNKKYRADEIKEIFETLEKHFDCNASLLMMLIELTAVFHDVAREGEGVDQWEAESGKSLGDYLIKQLGLKPTVASIFRYAIECKDKPEAFKKYLSLLGLSKDLIEACDYIRHLVHEADCLDLIRCTGQFHIKYLEIYQNAKERNQKECIEAIKELAFNVHALIYSQGDLLFDCKISIGEIVETPILTLKSGSNFLLKTKVPYEHSSNVLQAIMQSFAKNKDFARILNLKLVAQEAAEPIKAGFNPFIHGTNSSVLALLPRTNFEFLSPLKMMRQYNLAPMNGEISHGGLQNLADGAMCFGRLNSDGDNSNHYSLKSIVEKYTGSTYEEPNLKKMEEELKQCVEQNFSNINLFLISLCRARQWGIDISKLPIEELEAEMTLRIQFYYLILCITDHLEPNLKAFKQYVHLNDILCGTFGASAIDGEIQKRFTEKYFKDIIKSRNLDMKAIWKNPTPANIAILLQIFELRLPNTAKPSDKQPLALQTAAQSAPLLDTKSAEEPSRAEKTGITNNGRAGMQDESVTIRLFCPSAKPNRPKVIRFQHDVDFYFKCFTNVSHKHCGGTIEHVLNNMFCILNYKGCKGSVGSPQGMDSRYVHYPSKKFGNLPDQELAALVVAPSNFQ